MSSLSKYACGLIRAYQWGISPLLGCRCRFIPSCSCYAYDAFAKYSLGKATLLTVKRLLRCHPFGGKGYDPLPDFSQH